MTIIDINYANNLELYLSMLRKSRKLSDDFPILYEEYKGISNHLYLELKQVLKDIKKNLYSYKYEVSLQLDDYGFDQVEDERINQINREIKRMNLINYFETITEWIFQSRKINKFNWVPHDFVKVTILVRDIGEVQFETRVYKFIVDGKTVKFNPTLILLNIGKDWLLKGQAETIAKEWYETKSQRKLANEHYFVDHTRLHRIIQKAEVYLENSKKVFNDQKKLIINADGFWIVNNTKSLSEIFSTKKTAEFSMMYFKKTSKREIKSVQLFMMDENQNAINKYLYIFEEKLSLDENINKLKNLIETKYPNCTDKIVIGDSAKWISNMAKKIGGSYCMDKFHYMKELRNSIWKYITRRSDRETFFEKFKHEIYNNIYTIENSEEFIESLGKIIKDITGEVIPLNKLLVSFKFCNNHYDEIRRTHRETYISMIEAIQSNTLAEHLRYKRASFGIHNVQTLIKLIMVEFNKLEFKTYKITEMDKIRLNFIEYKTKKDNSINSEVCLPIDTKNPYGWITSKKKSNC